MKNPDMRWIEARGFEPGDEVPNPGDIARVVHAAAQAGRCVVPYAGVEGVADIPAVVTVPTGDRANLPA